MSDSDNFFTNFHKVLVINVNGRVIIPLENNYKNFLAGENNPEYGKMLFGTKFYKKVNSYPEYDNWSSDMELDMAYAGIYGKLSDLSLFSQTNCFDNKAVGIIKIHEFIYGDIPLRFKHFLENNNSDLYKIKNKRSEILSHKGEEVYRFRELIFAGTPYASNSVKIVINADNKYINIDKKTSLAYLDLCVDVFEIHLNHLEIYTRRTKMQGEVGNLKKILAKYQNSSYLIPGKIIVKEYSEDDIPEDLKKLHNLNHSITFEEQIYPFLKRRGNNTVLRDQNGKRILSFYEYIEIDSVAKNDLLINAEFDRYVKDYLDDKLEYDREYYEWKEDNESEERDYREYIDEGLSDLNDADPDWYWNID
jgi:hypothetical protein